MKIDIDSRRRVIFTTWFAFIFVGIFFIAMAQMTFREPKVWRMGMSAPVIKCKKRPVKKCRFALERMEIC